MNILSNSWTFVGITCITALGLTGCIREQTYRATLNPITVPSAPDAITPKSVPATLPPYELKDKSRCHVEAPDFHLSPMRMGDGSINPNPSGPCIAFLEYDHDGSPRDAKQLQLARQVIRDAIRDDPTNQPVIVGFVHGWKHNAHWEVPEDTNIQGLDHVLNYLYGCFYAGTGPVKLPCQQVAAHAPPTAGHVVVGLYFAWRGGSVSGLWPVTQQFTVYDRGKVAERIGGAGPIQSDLECLSEEAHPLSGGDPAHEPLFVLAGHSFGARLLELAIQKRLQSRILRQLANSPSQYVPNFADLIIYVNSAAPAFNAIPMLNFLAEHHVEYSRVVEVGGKRVWQPWPLILSVTTPADPATGTLMPVAEFFPTLSITGDTIIKTFNPKDLGPSGVTQRPCADMDSELICHTESTRILSRNSLPHLTELQSHLFTEEDDPSKASTKANCANRASSDDFEDWIPGHCFRFHPREDASRWNSTPMWAVSTHGALIQDHGTIFTDRLLIFLGHFFPQPGDIPTVRRANARAAAPAQTADQ
jgi:hypothetical protein